MVHNEITRGESHNPNLGEPTTWTRGEDYGIGRHEIGITHDSEMTDDFVLEDTFSYKQ